VPLGKQRIDRVHLNFGYKTYNYVQYLEIAVDFVIGNKIFFFNFFFFKLEVQ